MAALSGLSGLSGISGLMGGAQALLLENYERLAAGANLNGLAPQLGPPAAVWAIESAGTYAANSTTPHAGSRQGRGTYSGARGVLKITLGTGDFLWECWMRTSNLNLIPSLVYRSNGAGAGAFVGWSLRVESGQLRIVEHQPSWMTRASAAFSMSANTWYRFWLRAAGDSHEAGVDGGPTISYTSAAYDTNGVIGWGAMGNQTGTVDTDEIRIVGP